MPIRRDPSNRTRSVIDALTAPIPAANVLTAPAFECDDDDGHEPLDTVEEFELFAQSLRGVYPELTGSDAQLATLIANALEILRPDSEAALNDAGMLATQFHYFAAQLGGDGEYPDDED